MTTRRSRKLSQVIGPGLRAVVPVVLLGSVALLDGCATAGGGSKAEPEPAAASSPSEPTAAPEVAVPGDGTWTVGTDLDPGVYVGEGGEECQYQRLVDPDAEYPQVIVRGLLNRPVIEIMDGDGGFHTEGCGSWVALEDYSATPGDEIPGDGIWIMGDDVAAGTYRAEGGDLCLWQRLSAFTPELASVIKGGSDRRATLAAGDLAFYTEGCGAWTKVG